MKRSRTLAHETKKEKKAGHVAYEKYLHYLKTRTKAEKRTAAVKARKAAAKTRHESAKVRRKLAKEKKVAAAPWAGLTTGGWVLGGNDRYDTCAAAAVANSLLACTGLRVSDRDVLALHRAAAGRAGRLVGVADVLAALEDAGLAGAGPVGVQQLEHGEPLDETGLILRLGLTAAQRTQAEWDWVPAPDWGPHAVCLYAGSVVTWGSLVPVTAAFLSCQVTEAWRVRWD